MQKLIWIAVAGIIGTLGRYGLGGLIQRATARQFPVGTVAVNTLGCLLFGLLWAWAEDRLSVTPEIRTVIFIGFFGAFTTFSSFAYESAALVRDGQWFTAILNICLQNIAGLLAMLAGLRVGKLI